MLARSFVVLMFIGSVLCSSVPYASAQDATARSKVTIAVYPEQGSNPTSYLRTFADALTEQLLASGAFSVVDRAHLNAVLGEQRLSSSGQVTPASVAQLGRMLGVSFIVVARIDRFSSAVQGKFNGMSILTRGSYSATQLNLEDRVAVIEVRSGQIVGSFNDARSATSDSTAGNQPNQAFIAEEAPKLVAASATALTEKLKTLSLSGGPTKAIPNGKILDIVGDEIILSLTKADGVNVGQPLDFFDVRTVQNPDSGKTIETFLKRGSLQVIRVEADYSVGKIIEGSPKKLQTVRPE